MNVNKLPVYCLLLDARSAFDGELREICLLPSSSAFEFALREILTRHNFLDGTALLYLDTRLKHRTTVLEWDKVLMGPIHDQQANKGGPTVLNNTNFITMSSSL